jgi:cell volume regulation protein A
MRQSRRIDKVQSFLPNYACNDRKVRSFLIRALAVASRRVRLPVPAAAFFLLAAALASDLVPALVPPIGAVERVGTVALVIILFDGGASIGWRRFRVAAVPIATLGVPGTFATAGAIALFTHWAFGLGWITSGLLGAAIAPTDPAVMFSVLGEHQIHGRTGTILEGESGANDPVGIALMLGLIELATHAHETFWVVVRVFAEQMSIGLAIGILGGVVEHQLLRRVAVPSPKMHALRTLVLAGVVFGVAALAHGSGFLAVFVAGLLVGDLHTALRPQLEALQDRLSTLAEVVVFVALGLTIELSAIGAGRWAEGLLLAAFVALVARPLVLGVLLAPAKLRAGERAFVMWGGLKGAVPILLASFAVAHHVRDAQRIYETVFVVVLASVVVQGGTIPLAARKLGVEMRSRPRDARAA